MRSRFNTVLVTGLLLMAVLSVPAVHAQNKPAALISPEQLAKIRGSGRKPAKAKEVKEPEAKPQAASADDRRTGERRHQQAIRPGDIEEDGIGQRTARRPQHWPRERR